MVHKYEFMKDMATEKLLAASSGLGIVSKHQTKGKQTVPIDLTSLKFTAAQGIPVNSQTDTKECLLTAMLLLPDDRLLLADHKNSSVKLVDLQTSSMISQIELPGKPLGMCVLPRDRVAVCLYAKSSVVFLDTRGQITVGTSIKVDGTCYDIVHHNDQLVVSLDGGKIVKMDMDGNIIKRVYGQALFTSCLNMTLMDDSQKPAILVSDYFNHTVVKLDIELNLLQTIKDPSMQQPRGIIAVGKQLLLCSYGSHKIMRLDLSTGKMIQLLGESDGIQRPCSAVYSPEQNKLYITSYAYTNNDLDNNVYVYKAL